MLRGILISLGGAMSRGCQEGLGTGESPGCGGDRGFRWWAGLRAAGRGFDFRLRRFEIWQRRMGNTRADVRRMAVVFRETLDTKRCHTYIDGRTNEGDD